VFTLVEYRLATPQLGMFVFWVLDRSSAVRYFLSVSVPADRKVPWITQT